jgi:hypothetical protein
MEKAITREQWRQRQMEVTLAAQACFRDVGFSPESPSVLLDGYLDCRPILLSRDNLKYGREN